MPSVSNQIVIEIAKEAAKFDLTEQQILLTKLRVKRLKKRGTGTVARSPKGTRKPTLRQINKWKHEQGLNDEGKQVCTGMFVDKFSIKWMVNQRPK